MVFHEVRFPDDISRGARGGPERRTQVVELASGDEERNASWADSRRRYDAAYGIRRADDLAAVVAFFEARNGRLHGFRWKDWGDFKSGLPSTPVTPIDANTTITIGAMARMGMVCEAMIHGIRLRSRVVTWTMPTAIAMPSAVPKAKPSSVEASVTQEW